jgi:uncharacterized protein
MISRRNLGLSVAGLALAGLPSFSAGSASAARLPADPWAKKLIAAAEAQVGVTLSYDPDYRKISFPGGDVPREIGVCTDVIIRAYRDALGIDLQQRVNADMKRNFAAYPRIWGLKGTDSNIDHRRVPNLRTFLKRNGAEQNVTVNPADYLPGDIVTQNLPGNLAHIILVSNEMNPDQSRPLVIHNIGRGARIEDTLFAFDITGHYRYAL